MERSAPGYAQRPGGSPAGAVAAARAGQCGGQYPGRPARIARPGRRERRPDWRGRAGLRCAGRPRGVCMKVNGLRFWMLADEGDWRLLDGAQGEPGAPSGAYYDPEQNSLRLASSSERTFSLAPATLSLAQSALEEAPQARDAFGTRAYWDPGLAQVMATGALPGAVPIFAPP